MAPTPEQLAAAYWVVQAELYVADQATADEVVAIIDGERAGLNTKATRVAASSHDSDLTTDPNDRLVLGDWAFATQADADTFWSRAQQRWSTGRGKNAILGLSAYGLGEPIGSSLARHLCFDGMFDPATPVDPYPCGTPEYPVERIFKA